MAEVKVKSIDREEAIKRGYLEDKIVYLKPIKTNLTSLVKDPAHTGYFMWDGAKVNFILPYDTNGRICNPFKDEDEKAYFEAVTGKNLNIYDKNSWWFTMDADHDYLKVDIEKNPNFMENGVRFDLSDPVDNLKRRILRFCKDLPMYGVAQSPEEAKNAKHLKFMIVEDGYKEKKDTDYMNQMEKVFTFWGGMKDNVKKMHDFLYVYYITKRSTAVVPHDADKEFLTEHIKEALDKDRKTMLEVIEDPKYEDKIWITKAIRVGAIEKKGVNQYTIIGEGFITRTLDELIDWLETLKGNQDDVWMKINESIKKNKL